MKLISAKDLHVLIEQKADIQIIDVREPYEKEICCLGGLALPLDTVLQKIDQISREKKVVIHCKTGKRAASIITILEEEYGFKNLFNLSGGIIAYAEQVNHNLERY